MAHLSRIFQTRSWFKCIYFDSSTHVSHITTCKFLGLERKHIAYLVLLLQKLVLESLTKIKPIAADIIVFVIISGHFLFYIENGMLCVLIRIASLRRF